MAVDARQKLQLRGLGLVLVAILLVPTAIGQVWRFLVDCHRESALHAGRLPPRDGAK